MQIDIDFASRSIGLCLIISLLYLGAPYGPLLITLTSSPDESLVVVDYQSVCKDGVTNSVRGLAAPSLWHPNTFKDIVLPVYSTVDLDEPNPHITHTVLLQHGNLRNGIDYYCAAIQSLELAVPDAEERSKYAIIATQFLIEGDHCWNTETQSWNVVSLANHTSCDFPVWSSEGWKDGHNTISSTETLFSYDVFRLLIERMGDPTFFPNMQKLKLFGFSAGGQTVGRYAMLPTAEVQNEVLRDNVEYVVSDPSTYLYFDERRSYVDFSKREFGVPNEGWLPSSWRRDQMNIPWIDSWLYAQCNEYNSWRYGFLHMSGYFERRTAEMKNYLETIVTDFRTRKMTYLIGLADADNCKLYSYAEDTVCNDFELATTCAAMLQGPNRKERFIRWFRYLHFIYNEIDTNTSPIVTEKPATNTKTDTADIVVANNDFAATNTDALTTITSVDSSGSTSNNLRNSSPSSIKSVSDSSSDLGISAASSGDSHTMNTPNIRSTTTTSISSSTGTAISTATNTDTIVESQSSVYQLGTTDSLFPSHTAIFVEGIGHDEAGMLHSLEAQCVLFNVNCKIATDTAKKSSSVSDALLLLH